MPQRSWLFMVSYLLLGFAIHSVAQKAPPPAGAATAGVSQKKVQLTPDDAKKLLANAKKVVPGNVVTRQVRDKNGKVIGSVSTQTSVVYMEPGSGPTGTMSTSCQKGCTGIPVTLDPGKPNNSCSGEPCSGCVPSGQNCTTATCPNGCTPSCQATVSGSGGIAIALQKLKAESAKGGVEKQP